MTLQQDNAPLCRLRQFDFGTASVRARGVRSCRICPVGMSFYFFQSLGAARDSKRKCGSGSIIGCCPKTSMMSFDNGMANMQPDSHSIVLGCVESLEEFVRSFRCEAESDIFDAEAHLVRPLPFGFDK